MTVPATARRAGPYNGNGSTTSFSFSFKTFAAGDLLVTKMDALGVETTLVLNSDYSVTLNGDQDANPGGSITYPISGSALPSGQKLTIIGDLDYEQTTDLLGGGAFNARVIEDTFDRATIQIQQLEERLDRALLVPVNSTANVQLPNPEANELIGWNSGGTALQNVAVADLATAVAYGTFRYDTFTGTGAQTQFTLSDDPATIGNLDVSISGVVQVPGIDYSLASGVLVFTSAPANGTTILARYGEAMTSAPGDAADISFHPAGTGAVTRTAQAKMRETVSVTDFGAVGDGVANDRSAFALAFAASNSVRLESGKTYWLGDVTSNAAVFTFTGSNKIIDFNGAKVTATTSGGNYNAPLFELNNIDGFTLINPIIEDTGFDQTQTWKGITVINFAPTTGKVRNVRITGAKFNGVVAAMTATDATYDAENIWFEGDVYNCYYGINLANNGHNLTADYRAYNAVRSYFCYGVKNHEINCVSDTHAAAGNADFLIKSRSASFPTRSIRARFVSKNSQATTNPQLVFESQNDSGNASIEDCWIHYDDTQSGSIADSIAFRHYSDAGVLQATDPNTKARINVVGRARGTVTYSSVPTTSQDQNLDGCLGVMPAFCAILGSPALNATGDGTVVDLVFDTELSDTASNYNNSTGVFTAPRDGIYSFAAQALLIDKGAAHTRVDLRLVTTPKTFNKTETNSGNPPYPEDTVQINVPAVYLKKNETAKIQVVAYNGTKVVDIFGDSTAYTYFSGNLLRGGPKST